MPKRTSNQKGQLMKWLPKHDCSLHLTHNQHKAYYETVEKYCEGTREGTNTAQFEWVSPAERAKAIAEDSIWELQWYPDTPIGSYSIAASSLEALEAHLKERGDEYR